MVIKDIDYFHYGEVIDVRQFAKKLHLPIDTRQQILKDIEKFDDEINEQNEKQLKILKNLLFN